MNPYDELANVMRVKSALVAEKQELLDICPIIVHHRDDVHVATVHACGDREHPSTVMPIVSTRLGCAGFGTTELAQIAECWRRPVDKPQSSSETVEGALAAEYADDPYSDVEQALAVTYVAAGRDVALRATVPYVYTDHGGVLAVEFGEPTELMVAVSPQVDELVRAVNQPPQRRDTDEVAAAIVAMFDHGVLVVDR